MTALSRKPAVSAALLLVLAGPSFVMPATGRGRLVRTPSPVLTLAGEAENHIPELRERVRQEPYSAGAHFALGLALRHANFKHFGTLGLGTTNYTTLYYKPSRAQLHESARELRGATRLKSNDAWAHYFLGKDLADLGLARAAVAEYHHTLSLSHGEPPSIIKDKSDIDSSLYDPYANGALNDLGDALQEQRRYPEAVRQYQKDLASLPDDDYALLQMGTALRRFGRLREARCCWQGLAKNRRGQGYYGLRADHLLHQYPESL